MPILYSVISRGTTVLAKYAECVGNFAQVTELIMKKIPTEDNKLTYTHGDYLIHYISENNIIYMCITDNEYARESAFLFLTDIKKRFIETFGLQVATAIAYAMNTEYSKVLSSRMEFYNKSASVAAMTRVYSGIDEIKDIMVRNIDILKDRGERLELLVNNAENLTNNSVAFRNGSRNLARKLFWKRVRLYVAVAIVILVVLYVITSAVCGGLAWQGCLH